MTKIYSFAVIIGLLLFPSIAHTYGQESWNKTQQMQLNNDTDEGNQVLNQLKKVLRERIDMNSIRINQTDPKTGYMCIQVDKNSTEKVCKYWNNAELRIILLDIMNQDDEFRNMFNNYIRQKLQESFNKAFNKSSE